MSYLVVRRDPSALSSASIVIACAGHIASHNLQAIHLSSPEGYLIQKFNITTLTCNFFKLVCYTNLTILNWQYYSYF